MMTHEPTGSPASSEDDHMWWWRHEDESGNEISTGLAGVESDSAQRRFASRADAETWLGQAFADLADEGVAAVTLFDGEREVFGPMSLSEA